MNSKWAVAIVASVTVAANVALLAAPAVKATAPSPVCAKSGQNIPMGYSRQNSVLVHLMHYDKNNRVDNTGGFSLIRIGKNNNHIAVNGLAVPGCWVLVRLTYFGKKPLTLCVVVREHYRAMSDPAHPTRPAACPLPVHDQVSGFFTYRFFVQDLM